MPIHRRLASVTLAALLLVGAAGCGSSSGSDAAGGSDGTTSTTASAGAEEPGATTSAPSEDEDVTEGDAAAVTLVDGPGDPANTITYTADGAFDPAEIEVGVDEVITFQAAADAGTHAVTFNGSDTYTISGGLTESFSISEPGTYTASEYLTGATMTITVTG